MDLKVTKKCLENGQAEKQLANISHFHWIEDRTDFPGIYTREEMYDFLRSGGYAFIIDPLDPLGRIRLPLTAARTPEGLKYVRTLVKGQETTHLINLPDCEQANP